MPFELQLSDVTKKFGHSYALDGLSLEVSKGELVALLGPSGCGKTTALRIVAGLEKANSGEVLLRGQSVTRLPAHKRHMGMVFQQYSLFPNLTAEENVAFGLRMQSVGSKQRKIKARHLLDLVGLSSFLTRFPHELSGGQQQRVALARALAVEPSVLLLDEPLSALDAKVRANLRDEIRRIQLELGTTTIFVTHDQEEAMSISDRVAVMSRGKIEQIDSPDVLYNSPNSAFVAAFVGEMNRLPGAFESNVVNIFGSKHEALRPAADGPVTALVRPESIELSPVGAVEANGFEVVVVTRSFLGAASQIVVKTFDGTLVRCLLPSSQTGSLHAGDRLIARITDAKVLLEDENAKI